MRIERRKKQGRGRRRRLVNRKVPFFPVGTSKTEEAALLAYIENGGDFPEVSVAR